MVVATKLCCHYDSVYRSKHHYTRTDRPMWAREHCRISPPHFLVECHKRQLNQAFFAVFCVVCCFCVVSSFCNVCSWFVFLSVGCSRYQMQIQCESSEAFVYHYRALLKCCHVLYELVLCVVFIGRQISQRTRRQSTASDSSIACLWQW